MKEEEREGRGRVGERKRKSEAGGVQREAEGITEEESQSGGGGKKRETW